MKETRLKVIMKSSPFEGKQQSTTSSTSSLKENTRAHLIIEGKQQSTTSSTSSLKENSRAQHHPIIIEGQHQSSTSSTSLSLFPLQQLISLYHRMANQSPSQPQEREGILYLRIFDGGVLSAGS
jgi:hypothetical protein